MSAFDDTVAYLFVPGNKPERFAKALATGAVPILDLEDAVAALDKPLARQSIAGADPALLARSIVRINARGTGEFEHDIEALASLKLGGLMLPKAESAEDIRAVRKEFGFDTPVIALIETAKGMAHARDIATSGAERLAFGTVDFCADLRIRDDSEPLSAYRSELILASRLAGIGTPVDGVCTAITDDQAMSDHACRAAAFGFGGVLCIHPRQVPIASQVFAPSDAEFERALSIITAAESQSSGVISVAGVMVDRPVIELARQTVALYRRLKGGSQ